jgi:hypothetical protein
MISLFLSFFMLLLIYQNLFSKSFLSNLLDQFICPFFDNSIGISSNLKKSSFNIVDISFDQKGYLFNAGTY